MAHARNAEAHAEWISAGAEIRRTCDAFKWMLSVEPGDVIANIAAVSPCLGDCAGHEHRRVVAERSKCVGVHTVFLSERPNEALHVGSGIAGIERAADVCTVRCAGVGDDALPAIATYEDGVQLLTLGFAQNG